MSISLTPRQITPTEQSLMREHGQWSELFAAIDDPATVFACLLDTANLPASNDGVAEIEITGGSFAAGYAAALAGMTIRVGSAAGLSDLGVVRLRADYASGTTIKVGETSDVDWIVTPQVDRYLTIVDEFRVWPRLLRMEGPTDSATLSGLVGYSQGGTTLRGSYDTGTGSIAVGENYAQLGTALLYRKVGAPSFATAFSLNQFCFIANEHGQIGYITYIDPDYMSVNLSVLYATELADVPVYPILTEFETEVAAGDTVVVDGGESAEVSSITSDVELVVESPWLSSIESAAYHTSHLTIYMDYEQLVVDEADFNQQYLAPSPPVPILGGPIVIDRVQQGVLIEDGNPIDVPLDASDSYQLDGTIASYAWSATGGTLDDAAAADPVLTLAEAGTYRVSCAVTPTAGNPASGHRKIYAFDAGHLPFTLARLESCEGSVDGGGWTARLTVYGDSSTIRDQAEVVLFARDHYGATRQEIGQDAQRANVVMVGYIIGETITLDPELGTTTFEIAGPQAWLDRVTGVATAIEDTNGEPTLWTQMYQLTIDRMLWHLFVWRSTWTLAHDLYLTGDTRRLAFLEGKLGSLISQVDQIAKQVVLARAACDRYGRMVIEIDPQFIASGSRTTPIVQALATNDLRSPIALQRRMVNEVARLTVSGTSWNGTTATPYVSTKPGGVFKTHGRIDSLQSLALASQAQADALASLVLANRNNPFPSVPLPLAGINRLLDIAPAMYVTADLSDNARGLVLSALACLPKRITYSYDHDTGEFTMDVDAEGWTDETTRLENVA